MAKDGKRIGQARDPRGCGASEGTWESTSLFTRIDDARDMVSALRGHPELDLRRTGRTHLSSLGVREEVAEAVLNHAKEDLKATYNLYGYWAERKAALGPYCSISSKPSASR